MIQSYSITMQVNMSETMRECLAKCVKFAISKNAWISAIDYQTDEEVTMDEALDFLKHSDDQGIC